MLKYLFALMLIPSLVIAEDGWLKSRIKKRMMERQASKPSPVASLELNTPLTKPGRYTFSFLHDEKPRYYMIYLPKSFNPANPVPVVFALHGGAGDMSIQSDDKYYKLTTKAEESGYALIFPNGYSQFKSGKLATWNAGLCCGGARDQKSDDVGFIKKIHQHLQKQFKVDLKHVYAIGMSNGAMMSYRLACEASDLFKAIAAVAGTDNTTDCQPKNPVSILHIHALDDDHVNYNGGRGKNAVSEDKVNEFVSVRDTIQKWKKLLKCSEEGQTSTPSKGVKVESYQTCSSAKLKLITLDEGGHSWPGGVKPRGSRKNPALIDANDEIWKFFEALP